MNFTNRTLHLNPEPGESGGGSGAAAAGAPASGGAAPAFDASQYVPKSEYERLSSEFGRFRGDAENRFRTFESRLPQPEPTKQDKAPSMKEFLNANGEMDAEGFEKYQDAKIAYNLKTHRQEWEREQTAARQREDYEARQNSILEAHSSRQDAYHRANPDYNPDFPVSFKNAAVTLAVADSDYSAHIHHFFQKNPDKLSELRSIERDKGAIAALRYIGRLETQFETKQAAAPSPVARPTRGGFGGGGAKPVQRSEKEIVADWRD